MNLFGFEMFCIQSCAGDAFPGRNRANFLTNSGSLCQPPSNVNARDNDGQTPLFHVGYHDGIYAKALIAAGADVNARDKSGKTPIFEARKPGAIDALLDAGANINARDNEGKTAYKKCWSDEAKAYLKSKGATD